MKKNFIICLVLFITISNSLRSDLIDWVKSPWTWAGLALSGATMKLGYWAYLSKKQETVATQIDRARDELRKYPESEINVLIQIRNKIKEKKFIDENSEHDGLATLRKINYPFFQKFTNALGVFNVNPENSPKATATLEVCFHDILGDSKKQLDNGAHVPNPNRHHKQQIKTLALGTTTLACAIGAIGCLAHGDQR